MKSQVYRCDGCSALKGDGNRWLLGYIVNPGGRMIGGGPPVEAFALSDWHPGLAGITGTLHFCSEHCAFRHLSSFLRKDVPQGEPSSLAISILPKEDPSATGSTARLDRTIGWEHGYPYNPGS